MEFLSSFTVENIQMTPVKGTKLHTPHTAFLTDKGIVGDRQFFVIDEKGRLTNGRRHGPLSTVWSQYDPALKSLTLTFPDGTSVAAAIRKLSLPISTLFFDHYVAGHVVEGPWNEALSAFIGRPCRLVRADVPGRGLDLHPVTIVSTASVELLGSLVAPDILIDRRRFRSTLELRGPNAFEEVGWRGRSIAIGDIRLEVLEPVPRCAVIRQNPDTGLSDVDMLKLIADQRRGIRNGTSVVSGSSSNTPAPDVNFAVYARVVRPGQLSIGDQALCRVGTPSSI